MNKRLIGVRLGWMNQVQAANINWKHFLANITIRTTTRKFTNFPKLKCVIYAQQPSNYLSEIIYNLIIQS